MTSTPASPGPRRPFHVGDRTLLACAAAPVSMLEVWIVITVDDTTAKLLLMVGVFVSAGCSLLTGNNYGLFDTRRRWAREANGGLRDRTDLLRLPARETLTTRLRLGGLGVTLGLGITVGASSSATAATAGDSVVLSVLGVVATLIAGVLGTYTTPMD